MTDWSYTLGSLSFGDGTDIDVVRVVGLEDLPDLRTTDVPRARAAGLVAGPQHPAGRTVTFQLALVAADHAALRALVDDIKAATAGDTERTLTFTHPSWGPARLTVRPRARSIPVDLDFLFQAPSATIQLVATDPRIYGDQLRNDTTGVGSVTGGQGFPLSFPHGFGTATAGTIAATNDGNTPAPWSATLTGPLTSPRISLVDGAGALELSGFTLAAGEFLTLDSLDRTVLLNGTAGRYGSLTTRDWFELPVGSSEVQLTAASGTGNLTLRWRDTWL